MHLVLANSLFVHIPKTGGTWVRKALEAAGVPWKRTGSDAHVPFHVIESAVEGRFTFAFVRHPVSWYQSYWAFRMAALDRYGRTPFDEHLSADFNEFVANHCTHRPGALPEPYEGYAGWPVRLDRVGRCERLAGGLVEALTLAGERFDPEVIRACAPANVSPAEFKGSTGYRDATRELFLRAERDVLARYGYGSEAEAG